MRTSTRRRAAALFALATVLTAAPPATASSPPPDPTPLAVSKALVAAYGTGAAVDDSRTTQCMTSKQAALAYRTDRIIVRPSPTTTTGTAVSLVSAALQIEMGGGFTLGAPETLIWDPASDPGSAPARLAGGDSVIWRVVAVPISAQEQVPVVRLARRLRSWGLLASPDYLVAMENGPLGVWPEGAPQPAPGPGTPRPGLGTGTTVAVYDTGVPDPVDAILPPRLSRLTASDVEDPDRDGDHLSDLYYGVHLTAIAGVFATIVPGAGVVGVRITTANGVASEFSAAKRMSTTLRSAQDHDTWPQVVVAAFGTLACDVGPAQPGVAMAPLGLQMVSEAVDRHEEAVVVASAGNLGVDNPMYPAAFSTDLPAIISVGALDTTTDPDGDPWTSASRTGTVTSFSGYGPWVTTWMSGVGLPTYHAVNLRFEPKGPTINGYATVSGTSYAAPGVGGLVLEQISRTGQTPQQAWQSVRASGRACSAKVGGGVALALTSMTATSVTPADPRLPVQC